jgi:hypothetical protein
MRTRILGRWATRLALVVAVGLGGALAGSSLGGLPSGHALAETTWQLFDISWG